MPKLALGTPVATSHLTCQAKQVLVLVGEIQAEYSRYNILTGLKRVNTRESAIHTST